MSTTNVQPIGGGVILDAIETLVLLDGLVMLGRCYGLTSGRLAILAVICCSWACEDHDIGQECPELLSGQTGVDDPSRTETLEVVGQSTSYPCDELICIASEGVEGYCSKKCRTDAGCPEGFECRRVQEVGEFASESYCAWRRCAKRTDCGPKDQFCCGPIPGSDPIQEIRLCSFADNEGECP